MKIPAKYVATEFVMLVMMMKKTHLYDLVMIAAKACVGHVESTAYVVNVIRFTAQYVQKMMEWMLLPIVKVNLVEMGPFVIHAEYTRSTMIVGVVKT